MSKYFSVIIFLFLQSFLNLLNAAEIFGWVKDSKSGEGLPYSTVQVFNNQGDLLISGTTADTKGKYSITGIKPGKYIIEASYMGYIKSKINVQVVENKTEINFALTSISYSIDGVEISAEKRLIEKTIEKTVINVSENKTVAGGNAIDVMQTLPSVDIDIDGKVNYRGSDKVVILINGEKSELVQNLEQIPVSQIEKVEIINNPSSRYDAEGMSGIINIVLKTGKSGNSTGLALNGGWPENFGGSAGIYRYYDKTSFSINLAYNHNTKFQTKEHLRENISLDSVYDYYQFDREDKNLNNIGLNTSFSYRPSKNHLFDIQIYATNKFDNAFRTIDYETRDKDKSAINVAKKYIDIYSNNVSADGKLKYTYLLNDKGRKINTALNYSTFAGEQKMENVFFADFYTPEFNLQNTISNNKNDELAANANLVLPVNDSLLLEFGVNSSNKNLSNQFESESKYYGEINWNYDDELESSFIYNQLINAIYFQINKKTKVFDFAAGIRTELSKIDLNNNDKKEYTDVFPSLSITKKINKFNVLYFSANRRINRPTIKMLNPYNEEYADILNLHIGNPELLPEYVNSFEIGDRFVNNKFSASFALYHRIINQAITRVKAASNDSALYITYTNLENASMIGSEAYFSTPLRKWWTININFNVFSTGLTGDYQQNLINKTDLAYTGSINNQFKLNKKLSAQFSAYYRSKLPSVMGTYIHRYYADFAISRKILKDKGTLSLKITDVFNTYKFGLDLEAIDNNGNYYSQSNRRKNQSQYFVLNFIYNLKGKEKGPIKEDFFLDGFDK